MGISFVYVYGFLHFLGLKDYLHLERVGVQMPISKSVSKKNPSLIQGLLDEAAVRMPQYKTHINTVGPYVVMAGDAVDASYPYLVAAYKKGCDLWELARPYHPEQYGPLFLGIVMCFFGGSYVTIIAAVEAVRLSVWQRLWTGFDVLYKNYKIAEAESKKDDMVDADGNGVADVLEISDRELLTRKLYLFARTVDPNQVADSTTNIWSAFLAVVATLRVHFAQAITLGSSLGEMAQGHLSKSTLPLVQKALPQDLQKWSPVVDGFMFKFIGVLAAWFLSRIISGFHAAIRGANMFVVNAIILARQRGFVDEAFDEKSAKASGLAMVLAALGFYWQLSNGFSVPFPLNVLLLPITIVEWLLTIFIGVSI